ncbi:hypothetical protein D5S17_04945 [Pseudonocardiaceae bacterium YIM PH 21723]|nr:hypothetical protein D5S17_04945 [Pseudonocardiaceae bacterium YIM PH 21723]
MLFVLATVALVYLPGLVLNLILGLRGWLLVGSAPVGTLGIVALGAPLAPALGMRWALPFLLGWSAFCWAVAGVVAAIAHRRGYSLGAPLPTWSRLSSLVILACASVAGFIGAYTIAGGTHGLRTMPQSFDGLFHAAAVRRIAQAGDSGVMALGWIGKPDKPGGSFYPNAYHNLMAPLLPVSDGQIALVLNASILVISAVILPLGAVAAIRAFGGAAGWAAGAALVSTSFTAFPYLLWIWGALLPYALGVALVLPMTGLFVLWLSSGRDQLGLLVAVGAIGLNGVHSAMAFVMVLVCGCYLVHRLIGDPRSWIRRDLPRLVVLGVLVVLGALPYLLGALGEAGAVSGALWPTVTTPSRALGDALLLSTETRWPQWLLAGFVLVGGISLLRNRDHRWLAAVYGVFVFLFVAAAGVDRHWAKMLVIPWYTDRSRLMSLVVLPAILLAGWGIRVLAHWLAPYLRPGLLKLRLRPQWAVATSLIVAGSLLSVGYLGNTEAYALPNAELMRPAYGNAIMSPQRQQARAALTSMVRPGERVMNDVVDGTMWIYPLTGVELVIANYYVQGDRMELLQDFNQLTVNPKSSAKIRHYNVRYVIQDRDEFTHIGHNVGVTYPPGMRELDRTPGLIQRFHNDEMTIWEIDWTKLAPCQGLPGCDGQQQPGTPARPQAESGR